MSRSRTTRWRRTLALWTLAIGAGALAGLLLGNIGWGVATALFAVLVHLALNLYQLDRWITGSGDDQPNLSGSVWQEIVMRVGKRSRKHRKRRRALNRVIREFHDASNAIPDALVTLDKSLQILWFNDAGCKLLGLTRPNDYYQPITNLLRNPAFQRWLTREHKRKEPLRLASPLESERTLVFRLVTLDHGQHMLVVRDVTEAQRLDQMRRDFVANVSHELRTPLTVIAGYLETMDSDRPAGWEGAVEQMASQARRMTDLVEDLLTMARLEGAEPGREADHVDVPSLVAGLCEEARAHGSGHQVVCEVDSGYGILGTYKDVRIAFGNLIVNALRYATPGSTITLRWHENDDECRFEVQDEGPGIPASHLPRLTERFYRVDADRSRARGGTGLGLAIVKHILTQHGGRLEVESEVGVGSCFACVFPADRLAYPESQEQRSA